MAPVANNEKRDLDRRIIETFRKAIHTLRRFHHYLLEQIEANQSIDEEERCLRRAEVAATNATLDKWESHLEVHLQQGLTQEEAIALIIMAKQLRSGIEEFSE